MTDNVLTGEERSWLGGILGRGNKGFELQLHVDEVADSVYHVNVLDNDAKPVEREFGQDVLAMLREYAS